MKDKSYLIGPFHINFDITNRCNLRCLHCYNYSGENFLNDNEMNDEEVLNLIDDIILLKPFSMCLCGGEPLLRKQLVYRIAEMLSKNNIIINLVSNGILMDEDTAGTLKSVGINAIQISLDGMEKSHDKLRNKEGVFIKAINALEILSSKIPTSVAFTPTRWNIDDLDEVFEVARGKGLNSIGIQYMMPMGRGNENIDTVMPTETDYRRLISKIYSLKKRIAEENQSIDIEWNDPIEHFYHISEREKWYPQLHIRSNGNVTISPYLPIYFGNVKTDGLLKLCSNGLLQVYQNDQFVDICTKIRCLNDLTLNGLNLPSFCKEKDIYLESI